MDIILFVYEYTTMITYLQFFATVLQCYSVLYW